MICYSGNSGSLNAWREKSLGLKPVLRQGAALAHLLHVPHVYCFSESLVPRPKDWGPHIDICGFLFPPTEDAQTYKPDEKLIEFMCAGEPPVYIGFGSIVISDADRFTKCILDAVVQAKVRCLLSKGWMGLGQGDIPSNVFLIDSCPHDWLFPRCSAVVHHGGAGTTATGLRHGRPTVVVPFFGDQPFWGEIVNTMGVGPPPIPQKYLTADLLAAAITECFQDDIRNNARKMGSKLRSEHSQEKAVELFHRYLPFDGQVSLRRMA
tara:strand:- start:473 stop:1267 length:795 start_codon:yes stop_codon:yes gene_type:complete